jgi:RNA polymerase sigma-70 factor (ECF subfamily)
MILLVLPDISVDDEQLAAAKAGNQAAIASIYQNYFTPIYQFVRLRVGDVQTTEDLCSEIFIKFIKSLKSGAAPHSSLRGWIFRVARNVIYDHYGREPELPSETLEQWLPSDTDSNPEVETIRSIEVERAREAIRQLAPSQQEVLMLRFDQQLSLQETADIMGKNVNAIKALQFRAVASLRQLLEASED